MDFPIKQRELHSHHFDSTVWNDLKFRPDDIVVATYGKSGTTWLQQILGQLIFNGAEGIPVAELSPWLDLRVPPKEVKLGGLEAQQNRRFIKTHLPVDALVFKPEVKHIFVARDGRDVMWSMHHHHIKGNEKFYGALNETPGLVGPPLEKPNEDVVAYFNEWLDKDGYPFWPFWENIRSWWEIQQLDNVMLLHFLNLKQDMPGEIRKIAAYLNIEIDESKWEDILEHCSFDYMKAHAELSAPLGGAFWHGGAQSFINKGTNGRWRDMLSAEESARYEQMAIDNLGPECAHWLLTGELT